MSEHAEVRVGIIGCGIGLVHAEGYAKDPRVRIEAIAGLEEDRCRTIATRFDIPHIYREYQELLANPEIDAVSIAVPNILHMPVTLAALEAGKHVLVEKPLCRNAEEGARMVEAAATSGKVLGVSFQRRTRHDVELVRQAVANGELGRIYHAKCWWMRRQGIPGLGSWFTSKEAAGGGPLIDLGVHVIDMAMHVMGNPKVHAVSGATYAEIGPTGRGGWPGTGRFRLTDDQRFEVEDLATAFVRLADGATLTVDTSWAAFTEKKDDFGIQLFGSLGGARIESVEYSQTDTLRFFKDCGNTTMDCAPRVIATESHANITRDFVDAIVNGTPMSPSGQEGLERVRLIDAIYASAEQGKEIILDDEIVQARV